MGSGQMPLSQEHFLHLSAMKNKQTVPLASIEQNKRNAFEDYEIDKLTKELANFTFQSYKDFPIASEGREGETEYSVLVENDCDIQQDDEKMKGETDLNEDGNNIELETNGLVFMHSVFDDVHEDVVKIYENETECSVFGKGDSNIYQYGRKSVENIQEEEEEAKGSSFSKCQFVSQKDIGGLEQEPMPLRFSFLQKNRLSFLGNASYDNVFFNTRDIHKILSQGFVECEIEKEGSSYHEEEIYENSLEKTEEEFGEMNFDEVMEQIKLNLRNGRQGGLATIIEEEEDEEREYSLKVVEEKIKPLSIEEKKDYKDHIVGIQKVYRCYEQKMRKLDVLNYQAMYAIDLLQQPSKLVLVNKSTNLQHVKPPMIPHYLWPYKAQKTTFDPSLKRVNELHKDLELVYVGQICLSWEMLCWHHEKIQELKQYDSQWPRRYNLVGAEFLHFQVLIQQFIEEEPIQQGHRIQNYVKNRCVIRNLLQVPTLIDDSTKDKKIIEWGDEEVITSEWLEQIIKKSMQVFWEFVGDKDDGSVSHSVSHHKGNELKEEEISDLLRDIQTQLHKKERKLKDKLRCRNWITRKFQKRNEDQTQLDHEQLLAQMGLRLISKVINMKKLRKDHLIWCSEKLNQIKFVDKKIKMQYSFLLFPC